MTLSRGRLSRQWRRCSSSSTPTTPPSYSARGGGTGRASMCTTSTPARPTYRRWPSRMTTRGTCTPKCCKFLSRDIRLQVDAEAAELRRRREEQERQAKQAHTLHTLRSMHFQLSTRVVCVQWASNCFSFLMSCSASRHSRQSHPR